MDLRTLGSLEKAIPVVLRHIGAYVDLAEQDFIQAKATAVSQLRKTAVLGVSAFVALLLGCTLVIALTWDGNYRVLAIGVMAGIFIAVAIGSAISLAQKRDEPFASVKREWREDRELITSWLVRPHESHDTNR